MECHILISKKGVSPLIASVLLVSITLAVIYLVSNWALSFASKETGIIQQGSDTEIQCSSAGLAIDNVSYNCTSGKFSLEAYNSGSKDLTDFRIQVLLTNASSYNLNAEPNVTLYGGDSGIFYNSSINLTFSQIDRVVMRAPACSKTARSELEGAKITGYGC